MGTRQLRRLTIGLIGLALALGLALGPAGLPNYSATAPMVVAGDDPGSHGGGG